MAQKPPSESLSEVGAHGPCVDSIHAVSDAVSDMGEGFGRQ
jgi:hypothetical protein